jgi:hypothetical protein
MARRSELKGIANSLAGSFVSRNNDVDGYWALGKLYLHAKNAPSPRVSVELTPVHNARVEEPNAAIAGEYRRILERLFRKQRLKIEWLANATILIEFESPNAKPRFFYRQGPGRAFLCTVTITDDRDRRYESSIPGWCWTHDPTMEIQSTRGRSDA